MDQNFCFSTRVYLCTFSQIHQNFVWMISQSSKMRMLIMRNLLCWCMIYKLRAFRRDTLLWISILNKVSTPLSSSTMSNSNSFSCSSHTTLLLWNVLEMRDHLLELGMTLWVDKSCDDDSSIEVAISLASDNILINLHSCSAAADFLLILNNFCVFFATRT